MARLLVSLSAFAAVAVLSGTFTVTMLKYGADVLGNAVAATPVKTTNLKPTYVSSLTVAKADELNVAKAVPVVPVAVKIPTGQTTTTSAFTHQVAVEAVRVRSGPKKSSPQVFTLKGGTWVNIGNNVRGWVLITDEAGRQGWVYGSLLRAGESKAAEAVIQ